MAEGELVQADLVKLSDVGKRLLTIAGSTSATPKESLVDDLKQASTLLGRLKQSLSQPDVHSAVKPCMDALIEPNLLKHEDEDVRLLVAKCLSDIMRIAAPDAPFSDDTLKEIFELIVSSFKGLNDRSSPYFDVRVNILEMVATTRSCVVMLDLQCDDLILEMFKIFFETVSEEPNNVLVATRAIMCLVLDDSEEIPPQLLEVLLQNVLNAKKGAIKSCSILAGAVLGRCAEKVGPTVQDFLTNILEEGMSPKNKWRESYNDLIFAIYKRAPTLLFEIYTTAPNLLVPVIPMLIDELLIEQLDVRLRAVRAVGWLFSLRNGSLPDGFNRLHEEYIKRFQDEDVAIRLAVIEGAKKCLIADPFDEAIEFLRELGNCLEDKDTRVRLSAVDAICECANSNPELLSVEEGKVSLTAMGAMCIDVLKKVAECLQDKEISIRRQTMEKLSSLYKASCLKEVSGSTLAREFLNWIPVKLIGCQHEFRTQDIDILLSEQLFPSGFSVGERMKCWISFFSISGKDDISSIQHILQQKQSLQKRMSCYLLFQDKLKLKGEESAENKREMRKFFKNIGCAFLEPSNAESEIAEFFIQQKGTKLLKEFSKLLDPSTIISESESILEGITNQLEGGDIIRVLAVKCSHLLFGKEHLQALLQEIAEFKRIGNEKMLEASLSLLMLFVKHFPNTLGGIEGDLIKVLKENKQYDKECALEVLVKARDHLTPEHISLDFLGDLCYDRSHHQAKYALDLLASISGPKAFLALFLKLLDLPEVDANLPADAFSVSNSEEESVLNSIVQNFLKKEIASSSVEETDSQNVHRTTRLKIFGLNSLARVFGSVTDQESFHKLSEILLKFLNKGEGANDRGTSQIDYDHLRLAAAIAVLRLSKSYEGDISPTLFLSTVLCAREFSVSVRGHFFVKLHKLLEQGVASHLYGCAFILGMDGGEKELLEVNRHLSDFMEILRHRVWLLKATDSAESSKTLKITYSPEYLLFYLIHTLAQEGGVPNVDSVQRAFKQLSLFISTLLDQSDVSEAEKKKKTSMILAILRKMKNAEDAIDTSKTENTYILCDIGIAITKEVPGTVVSPMEDTHEIPLPSLLYRAVESTEGDNQEVDGSHLPSHLLSVLPLKINKASTAKQEKRKADHGIFKKVPQSKRSKISGLSPGEKEYVDNVPSKVQSSEKGSDPKKGNKVSHTLTPIENGKKVEDTQLSIAIPTKRKRSQLHKENGEGSTLDGKQGKSDEPSIRSDDKHKKMKVSVENVDEAIVSESDQLATVEINKSSQKPAADASAVKPVVRTPKSLEERDDESLSQDETTTSTKKRGKQAVKDATVVESSSSPHITPKQATKKTMPSESEAVNTSKNGIKVGETSSGSGATPKISTKKTLPPESQTPSVKVDKKSETSPRGLVGCRVKVWWPMDKAFYQGVIASYHAPTKRHKILYDDGDQENLKLDSERWELIENDDKGISSPPVSSEHDSRSKKKDVKSQPTKSSNKETDNGMSQKQSKHTKSKDVGESDTHSRMNDETPAHKKRDSVESDEQKSATGSKARSSGKKVVSSGGKAMQSSEGVSPTISKDSSEDVPLNTWKGAKRKARS